MKLDQFETTLLTDPFCVCVLVGLFVLFLLFAVVVVVVVLFVF